MIDVIVRSWISYDGFEVNGKPYRLDQIDKLKEVIGNQKINWIRGKNTFTGKPVSDKFMQRMMSEV